MKTVKGNIWDLPGTVCVPTNLGWKHDGRNVMGRGLAQQAAVRYPALPGIYGVFCQETARGVDRGPYAPHLYLFEAHDRKLLCVATKPLNKMEPWMSWSGGSSLELVQESVRKLADFEKKPDCGWPILVVPFGCGNGGLSEHDVLPVMEEHLVSDRFVLVRR